jgi:hypothetical protein
MWKKWDEVEGTPVCGGFQDRDWVRGVGFSSVEVEENWDVEEMGRRRRVLPQVQALPLSPLA